MKPNTSKIARDYGGAILAAVIIALFIRIWVLEAYRIPTPAMHPTLEPGDTIFVSKTPLGFDRRIERGDVLVFTSPLDPERDYIKRALGVAGDTVEVHDGRMILNGKPAGLPSPGRNPACGREQAASQRGERVYEVCWEQPLVENFGPEKVPEGSVFVLGDFRTQSPADLKKRKTWGIIPIAAVKGRARWIWLSIEPHNPGVSAVRFPNFKFERMFRRIE